MKAYVFNLIQSNFTNSHYLYLLIIVSQYLYFIQLTDYHLQGIHFLNINSFAYMLCFLQATVYVQMSLENLCINNGIV